MKTRILFVFVCNLLLYPLLHAYQKPRVDYISREVYQAANKNWSVGQDERGVLYFGNDIGLLESDGRAWKLYRIPSSPIVRAIAVESHRTLYTGGFEELGRWDRDATGRLVYTSLKGLLPEEELKNQNFWKIYIDGPQIYFQSFNGIYRYNPEGGITTIEKEKSLIFLLRIRDEYWVQQTYGPLFRLRRDHLEKIEGSDFLSATTVRVILPYETDAFLIGTASGEMYIYDGKEFTLWNPDLARQLAGKELNCGIYASGRKTFFLGTQLDGVYETDLRGNVLNHFTSANSLSNNTVLSLYEDAQENVWVTLDRGIAYICYQERLSYYLSNNLDAGAVYGATLWNDKLMIGTNQGVYHAPVDKLSDQNYFSSLQLIEGTQGQVWSFLQTDGKLFCAHNNGLKQIGADLKVTEPYPVNTGVFRAVETRIKDRDLLLLATYNELNVVDRTSGELRKMDQLPEPIVHVETDHLGNIWLETVNQGVYKCRFDDDLKEFRYVTYYGPQTDSLLPPKLQLFKSGGRILFLGNDRFWNYDENNDRLTLNTHLNDCFKEITHLKRVVHIRNEESWAITETAIYRFRYDGYMARVLDAHRIGVNGISLVNEYENISVLNDTLSLVCLHAGFILATTAYGDIAAPQLSAPFIESVQLSGYDKEPVYLSMEKEAHIPCSYQTVSFYYGVDNSFAGPWGIDHRIEQIDADWKEAPAGRVISYDRLPPGSYRLLLRTSDRLGHESETVVYAFTILPPWYRTHWACLLYLAGSCLLFYVIWIVVLRRYRNLHLQKIRARETLLLRRTNAILLDEIEKKDAELLTQTSFIIQKNELILKLKEMVDEFCARNHQRALLPLYQKMNTLLANHLDTEGDWKMFLIKFEQKHKSFFKTLKSQHPQLTNNDLRLCACLKLNMETKDIASLMNLSVRAVENNRYRLRKKLNLSSSDNLNEYFLTIDG